MDIVTKDLVNNFLERLELKPKDEAKDFEIFSNYSIISNEYGEEFTNDEITTGNNQGVDGIGIIVNGSLVNSVDEIQDLMDINNFLDVIFIFIQSKTSSKFEGSEIGNFLFTVKDFFKETPNLPATIEMKKFILLKEILFKNFAKMTKGNPICKLFYVSTGRWVDDISLNTIIQGNIKELEETGIFRKIFFDPCDAQRIQKLYRKTIEKVSATFYFDKFVAMPKIEEIQESYLGVISFKEMRNILIDDNNKIKNVFYDNVRDYLGDTPVNAKINETITNKKFELFTVLNNGITIVADEKTNKGNDFSISNYQIVNGCQTCHVLYKNKDLPDIDKINVPLRLIITNNENIKTQITLSTNRQTAITEEQLQAFSEFQKNLELFYNSNKGNSRLYYERRTGQYNSDQFVIKTRIITIKNQIKVFASMFLNKPHLVSGYYGKVYKSVEDTIFISDHKLLPYYVAGMTSYTLEYFFRIGSIDTRYKKARYHILMLFRMVCNGEVLPNFNSTKIENYCNVISEKLVDLEKALAYFETATKIIDESGINIENQKLLYQSTNTDLLIKKYNEINAKKDEG